MKLADDLREFVELLNSENVEYVIVGGHAVGYHGYPRYTGDIDIFVRSDSSNAARIVAVLDAFGFGNLGADADTFTKPDTVVQLGRPPNRIDILTNISGVDFEQVWDTRESAELDVPVAMIAREPLLINKRAAGRAKDLADVREREQIE